MSLLPPHAFCSFTLDFARPHLPAHILPSPQLVSPSSLHQAPFRCSIFTLQHATTQQHSTTTATFLHAHLSIAHLTLHREEERRAKSSFFHWAWRVSSFGCASTPLRVPYILQVTWFVFSFLLVPLLALCLVPLLVAFFGDEGNKLPHDQLSAP